MELCWAPMAPSGCWGPLNPGFRWQHPTALPKTKMDHGKSATDHCSTPFLHQLRTGPKGILRGSHHFFLGLVDWFGPLVFRCFPGRASTFNLWKGWMITMKNSPGSPKMAPEHVNCWKRRSTSFSLLKYDVRMMGNFREVLIWSISELGTWIRPKIEKLANNLSEKHRPWNFSGRGIGRLGWSMGCCKDSPHAMGLSVVERSSSCTGLQVFEFPMSFFLSRSGSWNRIYTPVI